MDSLCIDLQRDNHVAAVVLSEDNWHQIDETAVAVRQSCDAPLILFRRTQRKIDESLFDQVYSLVVPPERWLSQTAELIARGRALQKDSVRLKAEAQTAIETCRWQRARSRSERVRYANRKDPWESESESDQSVSPEHYRNS